jgi:hypothetical protein
MRANVTIWPEQQAELEVEFHRYLHIAFAFGAADLAEKRGGNGL